MSEAAARRADPVVQDDDFPPAGPRFAPGWRTTVAEDAARALFERLAESPAPRSPSQPDAAGSPPDLATPPDLAISLSELRHRVTLQARQLERAIEEIEILTRRLENTRTRAAAAEAAVARERALRGRERAEASRRLAEHERTISELLIRIRGERDAAAGAADARVARLERQLAARDRLDARLRDVIAGARTAIVEVQAELTRGTRRVAMLESELGSARRQRADIGDRERADVATACVRLEQELAARHALEIQAARLIGRVHRDFGAGG